MEITSQTVQALAALIAKLKPFRRDSPVVNDMFEAADDWKNYAQMMIDQSAEAGWDFSGRQRQEEEVFSRLMARYGDALSQSADFPSVMKLGAHVLAVGKQRRPNSDGVLGSNRIIQQTFKFLQSDFGLVPGEFPSASPWDYESSRVCVHLAWPTEFDSWCRIKQAADPSFGYHLEDILFMGGKSVSLALPPGQTISTEADVQAWFTTVADILRQYGSDVLADKPGAFDRLAAAAAERDRLIGKECDRLHAAELARGSDKSGS